ncbi:hypothetical protein NTE_02079 [Candidatus Nitrososphaera evergladensis SR1]|uniref:Uncharacterized protein n=1 Tax=Candidatus Nitrososphaera evergladensis SR1 TaxID=1459636 RepID=A0A075MSM4_9ARCH|nr:hypothetical protein [Candidatus Nitrososphaera evergladensis]AIF84135.1 hypothetical protein NTE_02079 [Candidatus Nitrososphaera evergladensis SR1]
MQETTATFSREKEEGDNLYFALCESCYWAASVLGSKCCLCTCPSCRNDRVAFIPLCGDESYRYALSETQGLNLQFSTRPGSATTA